MPGARSDLHAACAESHGSWTVGSTPNPPADMFRAQYARVFTDPRVPYASTVRILKFLETAERQLKNKMGLLLPMEFRVRLYQSAFCASVSYSTLHAVCAGVLCVGH